MNLSRLLSNDLPRSRVLAVALLLLLAVLLFAPFVLPGVKALNVAAKVLVFTVLVGSFDLLLASVPTAWHWAVRAATPAGAGC